MTQDEIRKLLGGYAANELTADERRILFEAALDDQELFNALENEDALRELLADPVSREQVRRALAAPVASKQPGFWSRHWVFGVAIPAAAAVIVIAVMNRANAPRLIAPPVQIASNKVAPHEMASDQTAFSRSAAIPKPAAAESAPAKRVLADRKVESKENFRANALDQLANATPAAAPQLAMRAPAPQLESTRTAMASLRVGGPPRIPDAIRQQFAAGFAANAPLYQGPLVRYSIVRGGAAGDGIRIEVTTGIAGYLALYQVDVAGNSKQVYPASEPAVAVLPNLTIQIPGSPIKMADSGGKLRLVVVPQPAVVGQPGQAQFGQGLLGQGRLGGTVGGVVNGAADQAVSPFLPPTPLVVDIRLAQN